MDAYLTQSMYFPNSVGKVPEGAIGNLTHQYSKHTFRHRKLRNIGLFIYIHIMFVYTHMLNSYLVRLPFKWF